MLTVHEVSKLTGVSIRTLQYYDEIGLLSPASYTEAGYRLYDDSALERLQQILLFRELEFPLKEIRRIIDAPDFDQARALEQQIELLGGTLWCGYIPGSTWADSMTYANHVTFRDGALLRGLQVRVGLSSTTKWTVDGSSPSTCDTSVMVVGNKKNGLLTITWDVDDVTCDPGIDFNLNGALRRYTGDNTHTNFHLLKTGAGTMSLNAACPADEAISGLTIIEDGTWLLGVSDAMRPESPVRLAGGTLAVAEGTANTLGALSIDSAGGALSLGEGASLTFSDSRAETWDLNGKVEVTGFAEGAIRFETSGQSVPRRRGVFTTGGGDIPLFIDRLGHLTAIPPGTILSFR